MERTLNILLIARDPSLPKEVEDAVGDLADAARIVVHTESQVRRGIEHALNRRVDAVFLELGDDLDEARRTAQEITRGASDVLVVGLYRPQALPSEGREDSAGVLIELMRCGIKDFLRRPLAGTELESTLRRHFRSVGREQVRRGRVVSFVGNKGGVGKSTLSLSTACRLARRAPGRVLLIDGSLQHGAMCELLDLDAQATICDAARQIDRLDERLLRTLTVEHGSGLRVLAAPANAIEAAPVDERVLARILTVARQAFDVVIVDTFPLLDSITVAVLDVSDLVFVVLSDLIPAVLGTSELLGVLERIGIAEDRIRVVLNHNHKGFRGHLRDEDVATRLSRDLDFVVPYSRRVLAATNSGEPYVLRAPRWSRFDRAVRAIEREVLDPREQTEVARSGGESDDPGASALRDAPRANLADASEPRESDGLASMEGAT